MRNTQIGIIGGGQLGMFLLQTAIEFPVHVSIFDPDPECSASYFTKDFVQGNFDDKKALLDFSQSCDVLLYETERVSLDALREMQAMGKTVFSSPQSLEWIQDKGLQRETLDKAGFPVPNYELIDADKLSAYAGIFPIVQKWRKGGYDGQGVKILKQAQDLDDIHLVDSVFEELVDIKMELSVLVVRSPEGECKLYPPIEMVFDQEANLVDYLVAPARIEKSLHDKVLEISREMAEQLHFEGLYAIEFFVDHNGNIMVNEVSPRAHNSGHHTLSANVTSQYEQQIRLSLGLPLGSTDMLSPCVMVNLLGKGTPGPTRYKGLYKAFTIPNVQYMLYGKKEVRPHRKMGHALILEASIEKALERLSSIRETLSICRYE